MSTAITFDHAAGSGTAMTMTAFGMRPLADVQAEIRAEAARLRTQEPLEVEHA